jgi:hypothetical protein
MNSTVIRTNDSTDAAGAGESSRLMAELSIAHEGRHHHRSIDAANYARQRRQLGRQTL